MLTDQTKALTLKEEELKQAQEDYNQNNNLISKANYEICSLKTELGETKNKLVLAEKKSEETKSILATSESDLARTESKLARTESILARTESDLATARSKEKTLTDYIRNKPWQKPLDFTNSQNQAYRDTSTIMQNMKEDVLRLTETQKKIMDNERTNILNMLQVTDALALSTENKSLKKEINKLKVVNKTFYINLLDSSSNVDTL